MKYEIYEYKRKKNNKYYVFKTKIDNSFIVLKFIIQDNYLVLEFTIDKEINWDTLCVCTSTDIQYYKSWNDTIEFKKQKINIEELKGMHRIKISKEQEQFCEDIINFAFKKMFIFFGL